MNENIEILQRQFDAYCTKVLKYASISYYHANRRRIEHEVSFSSLLEKDLAEVSTTDRYPCMFYRFQVREWLVEVQSCLLYTSHVQGKGRAVYCYQQRHRQRKPCLLYTSTKYTNREQLFSIKETAALFFCP